MELMRKDCELTCPLMPELGVPGPPPYGKMRIDLGTGNPYVEKRFLNSSTAFIQGPVAFMIRVIFDRLRLQPVFTATREKPWGTRLPNGTFNGMIGEIVDNKLDFMPGTITITHERYTNFFMSHRFVHAVNGLLSWTPRKIVNPFAFLSTFQPEVWALMILSMLLLSASCTAMARISQKNENLHVTWTFLPQQLFIFFTTLMGQSFQQRLKLTSWWYTVLFVTWFIGRLFLVTLFTSETTNIMVMRKTEFHVNTLEDILKKKNLNVYVPNGTYFHYQFINPQTSIFAKLKPRVIPNAGILSGDLTLVGDAMRAVEKRTGVIYVTTHGLMRTASRWMSKFSGASCPFRVTEIPSISAPFGTLAKRTMNATYKRIIEDTIKRLDESNIFLKQMQLYIGRFRDCNAEAKGHFQALVLKLRDVSGVFFVLLIGYLISFVVLFIETALPLFLKNKYVYVSYCKRI